MVRNLLLAPVIFFFLVFLIILIKTYVGNKNIEKITEKRKEGLKEDLNNYTMPTTITLLGYALTLKDPVQDKSKEWFEYVPLSPTCILKSIYIRKHIEDEKFELTSRFQINDVLFEIKKPPEAITLAQATQHCAEIMQYIPMVHTAMLKAGVGSHISYKMMKDYMDCLELLNDWPIKFQNTQQAPPPT